MRDGSCSELRRWRYTATALIVLTGSVLHFTYAWSNYSTIVGLFSPINESVWEHLKMAFWPGLFLALFEMRKWRQRYPGFWLAIAFGLLTSITGICLLYYSYTGLLGANYLVFDILCFVLAVAAGQLITYVFMVRLGENRGQTIAGWSLIALMGSAFTVFTFWAPTIHLFQDPLTGTYGIQTYH